MSTEKDPEQVERNKNLLLTSKYSDLTIDCQGHEFKIHRSIVCYGNNFFELAVRDGFREESDAMIKLLEDDPYIVAQVLRYLYTGNYFDDVYEISELSAWEDRYASMNTADEMSNPRSNHLLLHAMVYIFAGKCLIGSLKDHSFEHLRVSLIEDKSDLNDFSGAVQHVYEEDCEPRLRELFVYAAQWDIVECGRREEEFEEMFRAIPRFGFDMFLTRHQMYLRTICADCGRRDVFMSSGCYCGLRGFCSRDCKGKKWKDLNCRRCKKKDILDLEDIRQPQVRVEGKLMSVFDAMDDHGWRPNADAEESD